MIQIGWYHQRKEEEVRNADYACAAWYEVVNLKPGRYPIMIEDRGVWKGMLMAHSASIVVDGTVVSDDFGTRYFGMPIGNYDHDKNKGKPSRYNKGGYTFMVAESAYGNPDYEIFPEYEIRETQFYSDWDMEYKSIFDFYVKGESK